LRWHWDGQGNVMDAGRRARLALIDQWRGGLRHVLFAHTMDDVAETFLMRLKRGSGVDGLSGMASVRHLPAQDAVPGRIDGVCPPLSATADTMGGYDILRPCLAMRREELRHYIRTLQVPWVDDPTNDDARFERVRMRRLLAVLEEEGLGAARLAETAERLSASRDVLVLRAVEVWERIGREGFFGAQDAGPVPTGELFLDRDGFEAVERDTRRRLLSSALQYVASTAYRPRAEKVDAALESLLSGGNATLNGCEIRCGRTRLHLFREYKAVQDLSAPVTESGEWDTRWCLHHDERPHLTVRALGEEGWRQVPEKPPGSPPHVSARSLPALWEGDRLVACRALGFGPAHPLRLRPMRQGGLTFAKFLMTH
jgi:tRNA(Ile)-lysidine synthase